MAIALNIRLSWVLQLIANNSQYGYKECSSANDAIMEIEQLLQENRPENALIALMGLAQAFGAVNSALLWATLYRKVLSIPLIQQIAQGRQNSTLRCKEMGVYGKPVRNNVGYSKDQR